VTEEAPDLATRAALRDLSETYASAVDRRDESLFLSVFADDATLAVHDPPETTEPSAMRGHEALARVIPRVARFDRTYHLVGNSRYDVAGDSATGEVYCIAHHVPGEAAGGEPSPAEGPTTNYVMYIRYRDEYVRGADVRWRIRDRKVLVDWTERRPLTP